MRGQSLVLINARNEAADVSEGERRDGAYNGRIAKKISVITSSGFRGRMRPYVFPCSLRTNYRYPILDNFLQSILGSEHALCLEISFFFVFFLCGWMFYVNIKFFIQDQDKKIDMKKAIIQSGCCVFFPNMFATS